MGHTALQQNPRLRDLLLGESSFELALGQTHGPPFTVGDEHVNATIADAIENHGLSVFIWNTASDLKERVLAAPYGATLWKGLISTATRPLIDVFPSNQAETEEYRRIRDTFFM